MRKTGITKLIGMLLSITLTVGNASDIEVYAKEQTDFCQVAEQVQEPSGGVLPAEIEMISQEESEKLQELFNERNDNGEYTEPEINSDYSSDYGYNTLSTPQQQACYSQIKTAAYSFHEEFKEAIAGTNSSGYTWESFDLEQYRFTDVSQIQQVLFAVEADCPELFWLTGNFSYSINSQRVITNLYPLVLEDYVTVETRKEVQEGIKQGMESYLEAIDNAKAEGRTDMQIELMIHDMIILAIDYAYVPGTKTPQDAGYAHSIDGVFNGTEAVCEGYAKAFHLLANYADIESIYAVGYGDGGGHAWNLVCLDDDWYNIDVTWDDVGSAVQHDGVRYLYYNCNTSSFGDHVYVPSVFPGMYDVPETSADTYNYHKYYHLYAAEQDVADEKAFEEFMKNAISGCSEREDYLLQICSENGTVQNKVIHMVTEYGRSILKEESSSERVYLTTGTYFYTTSGGCVVYYPMVCIYADSYEVPYNREGARLDLHVVKGRNEIAQEGNYTVSYSGNEQPGTAQVFVMGQGDYAFLGTSLLEFTVCSEGEITIMPTEAITMTPKPTVSETVTPTVSETVTPSTSATVTPTISETVTPTVSETVTPTISETATPTISETPKPTISETVTPTISETVTPTVSETVTPTVSETVTPTISETVTPGTSETVTPTISETATPTISETAAPTISATPKPTAATLPTVTQPQVSIPAQVTGVKFVSATNTKVTISFQKQQGVSGYEVSLWKGSTQVKSAVTTNSTYTFQKLSAATDYTVKVRAFTKNLGQNTYGKYSKSVKAATATKAPSISSVKGKNRQAVIQWNKVKNSDGYEVYMSSKKNSGYKKAATITKGSTVKYTKKKLITGKTYYFKVRTYRKVEGKKVYSSYSKIVKNKQ